MNRSLFYILKSLNQKTTHQTVKSKLWPLGTADPRILGSGFLIQEHQSDCTRLTGQDRE